MIYSVNKEDKYHSRTLRLFEFWTKIHLLLKFKARILLKGISNAALKVNVLSG